MVTAANIFLIKTVTKCQACWHKPVILVTRKAEATVRPA